MQHLTASNHPEQCECSIWLTTILSPQSGCVKFYIMTLRRVFSRGGSVSAIAPALVPLPVAAAAMAMYRFGLAGGFRRGNQRNAVRLGSAGRDFPRRNRIVAGLCRAVVVVEAAPIWLPHHREIRRRSETGNLCRAGLAARSTGGRRQRSPARRRDILHQGRGCNERPRRAKPVARTAGCGLFRTRFREWPL